MLVNLCGPPASAKTLHAKHFAQEYPEFIFVSIDEMRRKYEEDDAWYEIIKMLVNNQHCVLETSGLSWHMDAHILYHPTLLKRGIFTIVFYGNTEDFIKRLDNRDKPPVPFKYKTLNEKNLIIKANIELPNKYPTAYFLQTDNSREVEDQYNEFKEVILNRKKELDKFIKKTTSLQTLGGRDE